MPFCPVCKYEYIEGISRCPDCSVDLVDQLDGEETIPETNVIDEELVSIFQTNSRMEATVVEDMLRASGISVLKQPGMTFYGRPVDSAQEIGICVFESQAEDAAKLIEQTFSKTMESVQVDEPE